MVAGWTFDEAAYMAVITVFAVGYDEVNAIATPGMRLFTILFVIFGCTGYLYIGRAIVQILIEDQIETVLGSRRINKAISKLKNHTVICGYGRVGLILADELQRADHPFVIIDRNEAISNDFVNSEMLCIQADATDEESLRSAGIMEANQVAVVLPDDAANVFITLSSRNLNPGLNIIARGMNITTEAKLRQAGANMVVLAEQIGAERICESHSEAHRQLAHHRRGKHFTSYQRLSHPRDRGGRVFDPRGLRAGWLFTWLARNKWKQRLSRRCNRTG
jgi:voltage-gated potassium channel